MAAVEQCLIVVARVRIRILALGSDVGLRCTIGCGDKQSG